MNNLNLHKRKNGACSLKYATPRAVAVALSIFAGSVAPASYAEGYFSGIGHLNGESSRVTAVSANGQVVVGASAADGADRAVRWTQSSGLVALGDLAEGASQAAGVSANGDVVVGRAFNGSTNEAFRWTAADGLMGLGMLSTDGSQALDVSADGSVVVGFDGLVGRSCSTNGFTGATTCPSELGTEQGFVWRAATGLQQLPRLADNPFARAQAVSADGSMIVGQSFRYVESFLRFPPATFLELVEAVGPGVVWEQNNSVSAIDIEGDGRAIDITDTGDVVIDHGFGSRSVGPLDGPRRPLHPELSGAVISGDGATEVGSGRAFRTAAAARGSLVHFKPLLMQHFGLDLTGWVLSEAIALSSDGLTITGNGINPLGQREGWVARLDAWPSAAELDAVPLMSAFEGTTPLLSAVLPASRSARVGEVVTAFATIINTEVQFDGLGCRIGLASDVPAILDYHLTDPATNLTVGPQNTPVDIPSAGGQRTFVIGITPTAAFDPTDLQLSFDCANSVPARSFIGLNTLALSASVEPVPDIVALVTDTNLRFPMGGSANAAVAIANVGSAGEIAVSLDSGSSDLPIGFLICRTNSMTGACLEPLAEESLVQLGANETASFMIQIDSTNFVAFDPVENRVFVRFSDSDGVLRGATSLAVSTQ